MKYLIFITMPLVMNNTLIIKSPAFENDGYIPEKYSCEGININPPLTVKNISANTKSIALIMDDPDAPKGTFDHWIMWNLQPVEGIEENSAPGIQGLNGRNENKYTGPCPPSGIHHYHFKVYALDKVLDLPESSDKAALQKAMEGHILAEGELIGLYKRKK